MKWIVLWKYYLGLIKFQMMDDVQYADIGDLQIITNTIGNIFSFQHKN